LWSTCNIFLEIIISQEIFGISKISFKKLENQIKVNFDKLTVRGTPRIYKIKKEDKIFFQSHFASCLPGWGTTRQWQNFLLTLSWPAWISDSFFFEHWQFLIRH
jgi:hypothetical protein